MIGVNVMSADWKLPSYAYSRLCSNFSVHVNTINNILRPLIMAAGRKNLGWQKVKQWPQHFTQSKGGTLAEQLSRNGYDFWEFTGLAKDVESCKILPSHNQLKKGHFQSERASFYRKKARLSSESENLKLHLTFYCQGISPTFTS